MYCQRCQTRPASCQWFDPQGHPHPLCDLCLSQVQVFGSLQSMLLPALLQPQLPAPQSCPACRFSWQDFQQLSHLGCPECYRHFRQALEPNLLRLHGQLVHGGRRPRPQHNSPQNISPEWLRQQLELAISQERFEDAARFRDQLRNLNSQTDAKPAPEEDP